MAEAPRPWVVCAGCGWRGRRAAIEHSKPCPRCSAHGTVDLTTRTRGGQDVAETRVTARASVLTSTADELARIARAQRRSVAAVAGELLDHATRPRGA
jgi:hypothetical protein